MSNEFYSAMPETPTVPTTRGAGLKKLLLAIIVVLVLAEVVWAVYALNSGKSTSNTVSSQQQPGETITSPIPLKGEFRLQGPTTVKVGETIKVDLVLSTSQPTTGADILIKYDPKSLELIQVAGKASTPGKIFQEFPRNSVDSKLGEITISGISSSSSLLFSGEGLFATLNFKAKLVGATTLMVNFQKDSTVDSNITTKASGKDILESVKDLNLTITN